MSVFRIAWRNLWRNWKRTAITFAAVSFSTAVLIASYALMIGWTAVMEKSVTDLSVGEVQVHHPGLPLRALPLRHRRGTARPSSKPRRGRDRGLGEILRLRPPLERGEVGGRQFWGVLP